MKTVSNVPELGALRLVTIYGDETTSLVSLTHRVVIADFDRDQPQAGIPHCYLFKIEDGIYGDEENEGFPGWDEVFDYICAHPELLLNDEE